MGQIDITVDVAQAEKKLSWARVWNVVKSVGHSLKTWSWTKRLLYWVILSAGTMAECVFLIGSLWFSINANVHQFVLLFIDETTTQHITGLVTTAYVGLPECIVGLAVVTTLSHLRVWLYGKDYKAGIWTVLYGLPTVIFLVLSLVTLGNAVANVNFIMPVYWVVIRALAGFIFAFTSLLYTQLGEPQEIDRLAKKDVLFAELKAQKDSVIAELKTELQKQNAELEKQKSVLAQIKNANEKLQNEVNKSDENALQAYSEECINWLKSDVKSVSVDDINRFTGISKRRIENAITKGILQKTTRNKDLIVMSSVVEWLKNTPSLNAKLDPETAPLLHVVNR